MGLHESLVDLQVGRAARQRLHINTPLVRVQVENLQGTGLAGQLDRINVLVTAVVASTGVTLGVFVGHWGAQRIVDSARSDIFRGDQQD
jgi:hypothetical protein